jgi:adenylate kinase family enzyme
LGASGSGTTTLASALAAKHGCRHLDTDNFYWIPTDPPFREKRAIEQRLELLGEAIQRSNSWVLSGSLCGWGDVLIPRFDLVVFLFVSTEVRMERLRARELQRYGHLANKEFLEWANKYDTGGFEMRSRKVHEAWLKNLATPVLRLEGARSVDELVAQIEEFSVCSDPQYKLQRR